MGNARGGKTIQSSEMEVHGLSFEEDTIVAVSTPPGRGGIGIVRLSGARAKEIAEGLLSLERELAAGRARFARVMDAASGEALDDALVTYFAEPHSYTAEDVVEIAAHGSPAVMEFLVRACCAGGARLAEPGEFTQRAFLRGRIDLTQAEAVDDLIRSQTMEQARVAARQLGGALSRAVGPVKERLVALIAGLEAGIDFAEDDIDVMPEAEIAARVKEIAEPLEALARSFRYGRVVRDGFTLAIVGRPNAGKSSLFNRLVERERAIVTATPGTTRDLVTERVALEGIPVELVDTAGLRESSDEAEAMGVAKSREAMADADVVLVVVDASVGMSGEDEALVEGLAGRASIVVWNKCDLVVEDLSRGVTTGVRTSALTGEGIAELRQAVVEMVSGGEASHGEAMVTNLRQQQAVERAGLALARAGRAASAGVPHEMVLLDLYECLQALDSLTGATSSDDILHLIFSKFCIGK
jgi:tRNA modification GTPase